MGELPEIDNALKIRIRESITQTLKEHPEGLCPRDIFEILANVYNKNDMRQVLSIMWNEDNNILGSDRKLRLKRAK
jgi:hypothetical protein